MEFNSYFYNDVVNALDSKKQYEEYMKYVCGYLSKISPKNNVWYYNTTGFLQVDVVREDYDAYLEFVEDIVGCSHCYVLNKDGITIMFSLSALKNKLEELMEEV